MIRRLKDFECFDWSIEPIAHEGNYYSCWIMHVFNRETGEEIARYE